MIYSNFKSFSAPSTSSLTTAYFYSAEDLDYLASGYSYNFPFGKSDKDLVEVYVYTTAGDIITSSYTKSEPKSEQNNVLDDYTPFTKSYVDVTNNVVVYSYSEYLGDFVITNGTRQYTNTQSLLINVQENLKDLSIQEGNYKIGLLPVRNVVGNPILPSERLIINEISPSRREIAVIPKSSKIAKNSSELKLNDEFDLFSNGKVQPSEFVDDLLMSIEKAEIYPAYFAVAKTYPDVDQYIKYNYSLRTDIDVVNFVTDLFYGVRKGSLKSGGTVATRTVFGIYNQFKNFLYENYESNLTFQEVKDYYYSLFVYLLNQELNQITNTKPDNYNDIVVFFQKIYYDYIFYPTMNRVESEYSDRFYGYLKNAMNFGNGKLLPILNTLTIPSNNPEVHDRLILKLRDVLPGSYKTGDSFWISNISICPPIVQNVQFFSSQDVVTIPVKGPNFNIRIENEGNSTINHSLESIVGESGSLYDELYSKLRYKIEDKSPINVDYRYFENFIKFSSVADRLEIFETKAVRIEEIRENISELDAKLVVSPDDLYYQKEKDDLNTEWNTLESSMDGYENFLYNNTGWFDEHTRVSSGISSASLYDNGNLDSLQNNLPSSVSSDVDNHEYVRFVNLIGHYFDNLTLYITQFTEKNKSENSEIEGVSKDVVYNMLSSLGWEPEIGRENLPLILSSFSKDDFDVDTDLWNKVGTMSEDDRNKFIWKRILNNLPFILKSKGTEAAINALISCYGIPRNLIQIKEYGGIEYTTELDQNSLFIIDETKYSPYFSGSGEYFDIPWSGSSNSLEFNFSFDKDRISEDGNVFRLASADSDWVIGVVRERGNEWGRAFLTVQESGSSDVMTLTTNRAPFFNGDVYSVVLRHSSISDSFNVSPTASFVVTDSYPQRYELMVRRNEDSRTTYQSSGSMFLSGSYNTAFRQSERLYLGNYQQNTASLSIDPEAFFGTIDEIRIWEEYLPIDRFNNHASFKGAYDSDSPNGMVGSNLVRISFSTPINLYSTSSNLTIENAAFVDLSSTISASNFPAVVDSVLNSAECLTYDETPRFPYQFKKFETRQTMNLPNFGSNKFRSNKINYKEQILTSNLSPETRSTMKAVDDSTVDTDKLGIFFSPTDQLNIEIIKFFGNFEFGDLIGRPTDVYEKNYQRFEKFKEVFYNQGFGNIDYQNYMNMVRAYFDKSLFKYIKNLVPARAKLVSGLLVEPSILERPKLQAKPIVRENVDVSVADLSYISRDITSSMVPQFSSSIGRTPSGNSFYENIVGSFYPDRMEPYGFAILGKNGVTYYKDDYWRVEVIPTIEAYTVANRIRPTSSMSDYDSYYTNKGEYTIVERSYEKLNISRFPLITEIPAITIVPNSQFEFVGAIYQGSTSVNPPGIYSSVDGDISLNGIFATSGSFINSMISSSGDTGWSNIYLGMSGVLLNGSIVITGTPEKMNVKLVSGTLYFTISSNSDTESIFDILVGNASGSFFSNIRDTAYTYRYNQAAENSPSGSYPLDGYFLTHYKYKKSLTNRETVTTLDNSGNVSGTFKKGYQTQKTTIQSGSGLFDNSLPVVTMEVVVV